jgi:hypothetical protein
MGPLLRYAKSLYELLGNRRKFPRMPMSGTLLATPRGAAVISPRICSIVDVSLHGMAVDCPEPMPANQFLDVQSEDYGPSRLARVRYCVAHDAMYRIGLEVITLT